VPPGSSPVATPEAPAPPPHQLALQQPHHPVVIGGGRLTTDGGDGVPFPAFVLVFALAVSSSIWILRSGLPAVPCVLV
jgi:hypothetical protein